jgi:hypothetical protein
MSGEHTTEANPAKPGQPPAPRASTWFQGSLRIAARGKLLAGVALLATLGAAAAAFAMRTPQQGLADDPRQQVRLRVMQEHLATQEAPYLILAGDSHAELLNWDRVCGLPVVNLGLSGVTAVHYGKILAMLRPGQRAQATLVFLGTNDLARRLKPESDARLTRFEQRFGGVMRDLSRFAARTIYVPVMPPGNDARASGWLATERTAQYQLTATKVCLTEGCQPLDLDAVNLGFSEDGVHLDRVDRAVGGTLHRLVEQDLCPGRAPTPVRP